RSAWQSLLVVTRNNNVGSHHFPALAFGPIQESAVVIDNEKSISAYEIDPALDRHEIDEGPVLCRERLDVSSAVPFRFSERVLRPLRRQQDARLGKRDPSPLPRWQWR